MVGKGREIPEEVNKGKGSDKTQDNLMRDVQQEREKQQKAEKGVAKVEQNWKQKEILRTKVVQQVANSPTGQNIQTARTVLMGPNVEQYCKDGAQACIDWVQQEANKNGYGDAMQMLLSQTAPAAEKSGTDSSASDTTT
ncbi:MAG TPA: hypothetical protein V6D17_02620 [Candidatus Obscuribacterales bacterium]